MKRWGLLLAGTLLAVCVVEIGLRFIGTDFDGNLLGPDPHRGWSLRPNLGRWVKGENTLWIQINSDGMRDREHALAAPPDTVRIAVLGDSYMQATNVPIEKTFTSLVERDLSRCLQRTGKRAEVLNFGVSGYGTAQELLTYRHHAAKYQPAVVLLAYYTNNDVWNNSRRLNPTEFSDHSPYYLFKDDRLVLDESFQSVLESSAQQPWWRDARIVATDHSSTARLLYGGWSMVRPYLIAEDDSSEELAEFDDLEDQIYRPPAHPATQEAWRVTEALLLMLNQEVAAGGAELWIVTLSNAIQVHPDVAERRALQDRLGMDSLFYPDLRIRDFAHKNGIPVITLAPALADYSATHGAFLNGGYNLLTPPGEGHWNDLANRLAAEIVNDQMCSRITR